MLSITSYNSGNNNKWKKNLFYYYLLSLLYIKLISLNITSKHLSLQVPWRACQCIQVKQPHAYYESKSQCLLKKTEEGRERHC